MPTVVEEGFEAGGLLEEKEHFHELLTLISVTATRTILFSPTPCPMVAPEEARFLSMLSAARQDGCDDYALHLLEEWLPPDTACQALPAARALAQRLFFKLKPRAVGEQTSDGRKGCPF